MASLIITPNNIYQPQNNYVRVVYSMIVTGLPPGQSFTITLTPSDPRYTAENVFDSSNEITFNDTNNSGVVYVYLTTPDAVLTGVSIDHIVSATTGGTGLLVSDNLGNKVIHTERYIVSTTSGINNYAVAPLTQPTSDVPFVAVDLATNTEYFVPNKYEDGTSNSLKNLCDNHTSQNLTRVCTSLITTFSVLLLAKTTFNQDISKWDTSNVTSMASTFYGASTFNQDISKWDTSKVSTFANMFQEAVAFNQAIGNWDVSSSSNFSNMFKDALAFNKVLFNWDTSNALTMAGMFSGAGTFNQDIGNWNVVKCTNFTYMFQNASAFNKDLSEWDVRHVSTEPLGFKTGANSSWASNAAAQPRWGQFPNNPEVLFGSGPPVNNVTGDDGNLYIDTNTLYLYGPRAAGIWSLNGSSLSNGVIISGSGAPLDSIGNNGNYYIDSSTGDVYGPKAAGVWPIPPISGGQNMGSTILFGTEAPVITQGGVGDWYFNTTTKTWYGPKTATEWPVQGQLIDSNSTAPVTLSSIRNTASNLFYNIIDFISENILVIFLLLVIGFILLR